MQLCFARKSERVDVLSWGCGMLLFRDEEVGKSELQREATILSRTQRESLQVGCFETCPVGGHSL